MRFISILPAILLLLPLSALAESKLSKLDLNSDSITHISFFGDSIVYGIGDEINDGKGGYPSRLENRFPRAIFDNFGIPGIDSSHALSKVKRVFAKGAPNELYDGFIKADMIVIALGVNDYWDREPTGLSWRRIKRIRKAIREGVKSVTGQEPFVAVAALTPTIRSSTQKLFIEELNNILLRDSALGIKLRFDLLNSSFISPVDGLHPTSMGYSRLTDLAEKYLLGGAVEDLQSLKR